MTDRNSNKRKRLTSAIRSYLPSWYEPVDQENNEADTIHQLQLKVEKLETEKRDLSQQVERSTIAHDLSIKNSSEKIAKLTSERNNYKALADLHQNNAAVSTRAMAEVEKRFTDNMEKLRRAYIEKRELEDEICQLNYNHKNYKEENNRCAAQLSGLFGSYKELCVKLKNDLQLQEANVKESTARELALIKRVSELESQAAQTATCTTNGLEDSLTADYTHVCNKLAEIQTEYKKLEKELQHFKSLNQNIEYLKEENNSLQERLKGLSDIENQKLSVDIDNANLRAERDSWTRYLSTVPEFTDQTPGTIVYNLTKQADQADYLQTKATFLEKELLDKTELLKLMENHVRDVKVAILKKDRENVLLCEENKLNSERERMLKGHIGTLTSQLRLYDEAEVAESETTNDEMKMLRISQLEELCRNVQNRFVEEGKLYIKALSMTFSPPVENGPYEKLTSGARITEFLENIYNDKESALEAFTEFKNEVKQHFSLNSRMNTREDEIPIKQEPPPSPVQESYPFVAPIITQEQSPSPPPSPTQDIPSGTHVHSFEDNSTSQMLAIHQNHLNRLKKENKDLIQLRLDENPNVDLVVLPKTSIINLSKELDRFQAEREVLLKRFGRAHTVWNENFDSADEPGQMEVDRVTEYNDEEEGYEEPDQHLVNLGYKSARHVDTMDEDELQAYEEGSSGSMLDDLKDDSAAEDELDYYESGDRESSYDAVI
ncbi:uncharacterized protein EV154DRAFT_603340 [Mucor mucedo]|uniref:uncharacterized protein n=1 Tax=Mucor mucedo TaxID=29922 RepID=UPI00221FCA12|nr:uncharacterized protein EV154DRAFT_603340 [Mucor mucedo]KAI7890354.1 hypothetical protein EV154DRAFT_603340 [Mucor mucedo]